LFEMGYTVDDPSAVSRVVSSPPVALAVSPDSPDSSLESEPDPDPEPPSPSPPLHPANPARPATPVVAMNVRLDIPAVSCVIT
jgi:hypothetical protein